MFQAFLFGRKRGRPPLEPKHTFVASENTTITELPPEAGSATKRKKTVTTKTEKTTDIAETGSHARPHHRQFQYEPRPQLQMSPRPRGLRTLTMQLRRNQKPPTTRGEVLVKTPACSVTDFTKHE